MRKAIWAVVAILVAASGFVLAQSDKPQADKPQADKPQADKPQVERVTQFGQQTSRLPNSLRGRIAGMTKMPEADVAKVLEALGPAVRDLLGQGQTVEVPNLGAFRVVRIPEHRDLVNGRPATIAGANFVEFLPLDKFAAAADQAGVRPAETVPPFEYHPLPDQTRGLKVPPVRQPNTRTP